MYVRYVYKVRIEDKCESAICIVHIQRICIRGAYAYSIYKAYAKYTFNRRK